MLQFYQKGFRHDFGFLPAFLNNNNTNKMRRDKRPLLCPEVHLQNQSEKMLIISCTVQIVQFVIFIWTMIHILCFYFVLYLKSPNKKCELAKIPDFWPLRWILMRQNLTMNIYREYFLLYEFMFFTNTDRAHNASACY